MSRRLLVVSVVAALLVGLLPSVGFAQNNVVTVRYFNFTSRPDHIADLQTIIDAFEAENPGIKIEVSDAAYADYPTALQADFVGGDPPDVFELEYQSFLTYAANDVLLDLSDYLSPDVPYYPRALAAFQYEGRQLALPETFSTVLLFYNKDLFDQAGIAYPGPDWTFEDARQAGLAITALGDDIWGIKAPITFWEFYKRAAENDCKFFNDAKTESTINAPECVQTLETMVSMLDDNVMPDDAEQEASVGSRDDGDFFRTGRLGMVVTGIWMFPLFADVSFKWDVQLDLGMAHKGYAFFTNGLAIAKDTKHPAEAAAWAQYLSGSETAANVRVASSWELPALDKPEYFQAYLAQTPPDNREAVFQSLEAPVTLPVIERQTEMQDTIGGLLDAVVAGDMDPQTALDTAKDEIDALLK
jgi:multiple sugar transport system substrate-binding protein